MMYTVFDARMMAVPRRVEELVPLVSRYGIDGIDVPAYLLDAPEELPKAKQLMEQYNLRWGLIPTPVDIFTEEDETVFGNGVEKLKVWAEEAEYLGVKYAYNHVWPSSVRPYEENFEWHVKRLEKVQDIFFDHGIQYGLEFIGTREIREEKEYPFVYNISGVFAIAKAAGGKPGFVFDTHHWFCGSGKEDDLYFAAKNCEKMVYFHLNDGTAGLNAEEQLDLVREMPMTTGVIDAAKIWKMFVDNGYRGPAACEPMSPTTDRFQKLTIDQCVKEVKDAFDRCAK